mmetsp:Transcript_3026/g.7750  ORF Transcript_3026/g.7750 Transcript_3026/m.7750 type:complete len:202 (-) Transcript_3026:216-821(-)
MLFLLNLVLKAMFMLLGLISHEPLLLLIGLNTHGQICVRCLLDDFVLQHVVPPRHQFLRLSLQISELRVNLDCHILIITVFSTVFASHHCRTMFDRGFMRTVGTLRMQGRFPGSRWDCFHSCKSQFFLEHCKIPLQLLVSLCKMSPTVLEVSRDICEEGSTIRGLASLCELGDHLTITHLINYKARCIAPRVGADSCLRGC